MDSSGKLLVRSREGYFGDYFHSYKAAMEIYTKVALARAHKQLFTRVSTLFYFLLDKTNP